MRWMMTVKMPDGDTPVTYHYNSDAQVEAAILLNLPGTLSPMARKAFDEMTTDQTSVTKSGWRVEISRVYEEDLSDEDSTDRQ